MIERILPTLGYWEARMIVTKAVRYPGCCLPITSPSHRECAQCSSDVHRQQWHQTVSPSLFSAALWQSPGVGVLCGVYMLAWKPRVPTSPLLRELMLSHFSKQNPTNTNKPTHKHTKACSQCWLIFVKSIQVSLPARDSRLLYLSWISCTDLMSQALRKGRQAYLWLFCASQL